MKYLILLIIPVLLAGCWNEDNAKDINLGSVSLGQQMIDLQVALEKKAITPDEYETLKDTVMALNTLCISQKQEAT